MTQEQAGVPSLTTISLLVLKLLSTQQPQTIGLKTPLKSALIGPPFRAIVAAGYHFHVYLVYSYSGHYLLCTWGIRFGRIFVIPDPDVYPQAPIMVTRFHHTRRVHPLRLIGSNIRARVPGRSIKRRWHTITDAEQQLLSNLIDPGMKDHVSAKALAAAIAQYEAG